MSVFCEMYVEIYDDGILYSVILNIMFYFSVRCYEKVRSVTCNYFLNISNLTQLPQILCNNSTWSIIESSHFNWWNCVAEMKSNTQINCFIQRIYKTE